MELNEYLVKLLGVIKEMDCINLFNDSAKLTKTEFRLLREIALEGENGNDIISSELARRLGITRSAVSQIISKLEKQNIVVRAPSPVDKKIAYVRFSEQSRAMFEEQCRQANRLMEKVVSEIDTEKMDALVSSSFEFVTVMKRVRAACEKTACEKEVCCACDLKDKGQK